MYFPYMEQTQQQIIEYYNAFYNTEGFTYYPPEFTRAVLESLCAKAGIKTGARVLDVGCATGYYSAMFASLGYAVTGIDISETGIQKARERYPDIRFEVQDATALPYPAGSFDFVFALGVSVANTRDLGEMHTWLRHMLGVLSPGGTLALLGGSDLSGETSKTSDWFNHTWSEIQQFIPPGSVQVRGPWLSHFRLMKSFPPSLAMNGALTQLLRWLPMRFQRRIVLLIKFNR
jgi:ubiquinone/menaquinone biosynthesis C-methylase UbiE